MKRLFIKFKTSFSNENYIKTRFKSCRLAAAKISLFISLVFVVMLCSSIIASAAPLRFDYTGSKQTYTIPTTGTYKLEVYGAQGGAATGAGSQYVGGYGGYAYGTKNFNAGDVINIFVGGRGQSTTQALDGGFGTTYLGGFGGGGNGSGSAGAGGGGSTDIRLSAGTGSWSDSTGLSSRIIVAGGGGGGASTSYIGGEGGETSYLYGSSAQGQNGFQDTYSYGYGCNTYFEPADQGGGGGGYIGGQIYRDDNAIQSYGGSSYIGGVSNGGMTSKVNIGNGYVLITRLPTITLTSPSANQTINASGTITISGTVTYPDVSKTITISAVVAGVTKSTTVASPAANSAWSLSWSGSELAQGYYTSDIPITSGDGTDSGVTATYTGDIAVDKSGFTTPSVPSGFTHTVGTWDTGYVIQDSIGNEWVWVPVGGINGGLIRRDLSTVGGNTVAQTTDTVPSNITNAITAKGGFYVARYEMSSNSSKAQTKTNQVVWNYIDWATASSKGSSMGTDLNYPSNVSTHLIYDTEWDTIMQWMKDSGINVSSDSSSWGNYTPTTGVVQNSGSNSAYMQKNISDLAGNMWEWTQGVYSSNHIMRGGSYTYSGSSDPAAYRASSSTSAIWLGWRAAFVLVSSGTAPTITISSPSSTVTKGGPITYTVTYGGASTVSLSNGDIALNKTGTANGTVGVSGTGTTTRTVTISGITGDGTLSISIASGTADNGTGMYAATAGPSAAFTVDNTSPTVNAPTSSGITSTSFTATANANDIGTPLQYLFNLNGSDLGVWQSSNTYTFTGLTPSTQYTIKYKAQDALGNISGYSPTVNVTTMAPPISAVDVMPNPILDEYNNDNASDIRVMFKGINDESKLQEYRIVVSKNASLNLNAALALTPAATASQVGKFVSEPLKGKGRLHMLNLPANLKDDTGAAINQAGGTYTIYVLSVAKGGSQSNIMALGTISLNSGLSLTALSAPIVSDISNNGDASDLRVTFKKPVIESDVLEYRVFVRNTSGPTFNLTQANNNTNYKKVQPATGKSLSYIVSLDNTMTDISGAANTITNNQTYEIYVLAVMKSSATANVLSAASKPIRLSALVPSSLPVRNLTAVKIGSGHAGSNISVTFSEPLVVTNVQEYRVFICAGTGSLDSVTATALGNTRYIKVDSTVRGTAHTITLTGLNNSHDGTALAAGDYKVYVLTVGKTSVYANRLTGPSRIVKLD